MDKQITIKGKFSLEGVGLHTGKHAKIELSPLLPNSGILFERKDIPGSNIIKADFYSMLDPEKFPRRTSIGSENTYVHTIEHLMATLHILNIDNVKVDIWGEEIPGLDGSAKEFVNKIKEVGLQEQEHNKKYLTPKETLWVEENNASIVILPSSDLRISYSLSYNNSFIGTSFCEVILNGNLTNNFYEARTFCIEEEIKSLLDMGLGKGSNYDNTLVVSTNGILKNTLRFPDEFVKHKILDLIGDLYLAGPIKGHIIAIRSGHSLNIKLLQKLRQYKEKILSSGISSKSTYCPEGNEINAREIIKILPHRYPFLLVDRIIHFEKGKKAIGIKNVTVNENFFQGHFPGNPIMPGVLIVEAMAQVGGVLMLACEEHRGKLAYFMAADKVKFRKTVIPGDQLLMEIEIRKVKTKTGIVYARTLVNDKVAAEGELMFALVES